MKRQIKLLSLAVIGAFCIGSFSGMVPAAANAGELEATVETLIVGGPTIPSGITIGGNDVSGMNASQALAELQNTLSVYDETVFSLDAQGSILEATGKDLHIIPLNTDVIETAMQYGSRGNLIERFMAKSDIDSGKGKDFALTLTCDWNSTKGFLDENVGQLDSAPVNHSIVRQNGGFSFVEGKTGLAVNTEASATAISDYITTQWDGGNATIGLMVETREPKGSKEDLLQVRDLLGTCSTDFSTSGPARSNNLRVGASKLDKAIIYPGETFSVSDNLGKRNEENGYKPAPSYENGITVDTYGGGVCQISTTLYNAVIRSELEVVERSPHSMVVSYVKPSMDAAISEGSKDFKFRNNTNYPVYIEGYTSGATLCFNIFGKDERPSGRSVTFESEVISTTEPPDKFVADASLPLGTIQRKQSAHVGYTARLWKVVKENGVEQSRDVFNNSSYRASSAVYAVGTASDNEAAKAAMNQAIASQSREIIEQAGSGGAPDASGGGEGESSSAPDSDPGTEGGQGGTQGGSQGGGEVPGNTEPVGGDDIGIPSAPDVPMGDDGDGQ